MRLLWLSALFLPSFFNKYSTASFQMQGWVCSQMHLPYHAFSAWTFARACSIATLYLLCSSALLAPRFPTVWPITLYSVLKRTVGTLARLLADSLQGCWLLLANTPQEYMFFQRKEEATSFIINLLVAHCWFYRHLLSYSGREPHRGIVPGEALLGAILKVASHVGAVLIPCRAKK